LDGNEWVPRKMLQERYFFPRRSKTIFRNSRFAILYEEKRFNIQQLIFIINIIISLSSIYAV